MPYRFESSLNLAVEDLKGQPGIDGILFFGSAQTGTAGPTSDLDLYVILGDPQAQPQISLRRYAGIDAEVHLAPAGWWRDRIEAGKAVIVHAFATGEGLVDTSGAVAELADQARARLREGPPALSQFEIDRWRYRLADLSDDLEDVAGQPADERLLGAMVAHHCLEAYCELHQLWGDKPKRLISYVERHDPELGRMARVFFAGDLDRHLAQRMVERVLAPFGGALGVWETEGNERGTP
ncbi:MAG TPA: nucleotidyltransferase domain-containing protein [Symbiobacteriaceae bacterium]|nr:nucleotidyltransferase domain-containing protein [Symbiobacteriaceae bacterium]